LFSNQKYIFSLKKLLEEQKNMQLGDFAISWQLSKQTPKHRAFKRQQGSANTIKRFTS
jgi:hypothetical protein